MDDGKHYSSNHHSHHPSSSRRSKLPTRNPNYPHSVTNRYAQLDDDDDDQEENVQDEEDYPMEEDDDVSGGYNDNDDDDEDDEGEENGYHGIAESVEGSERYGKKRKVENFGDGYEFARRAGTGTGAGRSAGSSAKQLPSQNAAAEWTEDATFVLLEAWGERFIQLGRKSLRSDDWNEVAEKVSEAMRAERTQIQCRNRLDTLKKRYKKEKAKLEKNGDNGNKWVYFNKLDMLMASPSRQLHHALACGVDSGEYVFSNPKVYLSRSNGFDEMRDSPGDSEVSNDDGGNDSDGLPPGRLRFGGDDDCGDSFRLLADSIEKFGEIYEKIEHSKRQQMVELENMRIDFHRELELQKKQMVERAQAEIARIQEDDEEGDTDVSAENLSG